MKSVAAFSTTIAPALSRKLLPLGYRKVKGYIYIYGTRCIESLREQRTRPPGKFRDSCGKHTPRTL